MRGVRKHLWYQLGHQDKLLIVVCCSDNMSILRVFPMGLAIADTDIFSILIFLPMPIIQSIDMVYLPILGHFCYLSITGEGSSQNIYKISFYNKFYLILKSFWGFTKVIIILLFHKVYILNFHYWNRHTIGVVLNKLFI